MEMRTTVRRPRETFFDVRFDGDLMQRCAGVPSSGRLSRGSKGSVSHNGGESRAEKRRGAF